MKVILKTIPSNLDLKYDETFTSKANIDIRRKLVPELIDALKLNFHPTQDQLTKWLNSLHKSRRSRSNYAKKDGRKDLDNQHIH
jgi:hypothetical protein